MYYCVMEKELPINALDPVIVDAAKKIEELFESDFERMQSQQFMKGAEKAFHATPLEIANVALKSAIMSSKDVAAVSPRRN